MKTKEEIEEKLDRLFARLKEYPLSQAISDAIDKNLALLAELEESETLEEEYKETVDRTAYMVSYQEYLKWFIRK